MLPIHQSKPPKHLGRFEVGAKIGGGGMATVYLGREIREDGSETFVALKVIRDEFANDERFTAMFIDEAKILARLSHPNVIQTLEYGVTGAHRFIAMELLNGRTVADVWDVIVADGGKFDLGLAAWVCARVAEGLHSAHELVDEGGTPLNVIHRDVNPTNIFLTHSGEVKLIDFGLARARVRLSKSADGIVKGKIPYLAPEQAQGQPIDRRCDIYALGTTLWEMSTMKRLFKRDNDVDTLKAIRDAYVPDPRKEIPDFPEALWKIIDRALRRDRDERYANAEELRAELDAFARLSGPHVTRLSALVSRLFPGGEARQAKWLRDAAALRVPSNTMTPPAPVPIASSSLLRNKSAEPEAPLGMTPDAQGATARDDAARSPSVKPSNKPPRPPPTQSGGASSTPPKKLSSKPPRPPPTQSGGASSTPPKKPSSKPPRLPSTQSGDASSAPPEKHSSKPPRPSEHPKSEGKSKRTAHAGTKKSKKKGKKGQKSVHLPTPSRASASTPPASVSTVPPASSEAASASPHPLPRQKLWKVVVVTAVVLLVLAIVASR